MKTFLLCLGAHKAGTSWLHHELSRQPFADFGAFKEYHVFDAREDGDKGTNFFRRNVVERAKHQIEVHESNLVPANNPDIWMRMAFQAIPELYFSYLEGRIGTDPEVMLTGDFTPNYSGLSIKSLTEIRTELIRRGFSPRVVFLMRDPVERCWSMERSRPHRQHEDTADPKVRQSWESALLETYATPSMERRTRYDLTVNRVRKVFQPEETRFILHETMFSQDTMDDLCKWLDVPRFAARIGSRINESPSGPDLSDETRKTLAAHYASAYRIACEVFGTETIKEHWPSSRWGLGE